MALFSKSHYVWLESFFRDEIHAAKKRDEKAGGLGIREKYLQELINRLGKEIEANNNGFDRARFEMAIYCPDLESEEELKDEIRKQYQNFSEPA
jgi:hypothetical protein